MTVLIRAGRLMPVVGLLANAIRYRGMRCGIGVEIEGVGQLTFGRNVNLGQGTRIELPYEGVVDLADNVSISRGAHIVPEVGRRVSIGKGTTVQDGCRIYGEVSIGRQCVFAPNVFVSSGTHAFDTLPHRPIQEQEQLAPVPGRPILIFSDCWFGINAVVLPGVTVGRGCVIGANAVVNSDLPPYSVAAGCPALVVKERLRFASKSKIVAGEERDWPYFYDGFDLSLRAGEDAFAVESDFILAMRHAGARAIRIWASGENCSIGFRGTHWSLPARPEFVQFELDADSSEGPFFEFSVSGRCHVRGAELV